MTQIARIKQIPLTEFLEKLGHVPSSRSGAEQLYLSPLRDENTPSFSVNDAKGLWMDFGDGSGGDIITLMQRLENISSVGESLRRIEQIVGLPSAEPKSRPTSPTPAASKPTEVTSVRPLTSKSLIHYLQSRGIDAEAAAPFTNEVRYRYGDKEYFAIGFKNDLDGFELRTAKVKRTMGQKAITTFKGKGGQLSVYEGFMDCLTSATQLGKLPAGSTLVLNSVGMKQAAVDWIKEHPPTVINLYADNDPSGRQLVEYFRAELPDIAIVDFSHMYEGYGDLNEWHVACRLNGRVPHCH